MKRKEDPMHLLGRATFVDDIKEEGMLFCAIVRSPHAKAKIRSVARPNDERLIDFLDGKELAKVTKPYSKFDQEERKFENRALAVDQVHYAGEAVAAVLAKSRYDAEDLVELVEVEYEPTDAVVDSDSALSNDKKAIDSWPNNIALQKTLTRGDFQKALGESAHHFELETRIMRQAAIPIETRGNITIYNPETSELMIWNQSKGPHTTRATASQVFSLPEQSVQIKVPSVGGSFGIKANYYPEEIVAAAFAMRNVKKPIKWIGTRSEDLLATMQARDQIHKTTICLDKNLKITGFKDEFLVDIGTPGSLSLSPPQRLVPLLGGCYKIPNVLVTYKAVATNKPPMGPIRGNGRPESLLVTERALEDAARRLGVDPVELRSKNLLRSIELPYNNGLGSTYDTGNYGEALSRVVKSSEYYKLLTVKKQEEDDKLLGIGLSSYVEDTGGPPGKSGKPQYETANVRVERDGSVTAYSGSSPQGQGHETTFSKIIADELTIDETRIRIKFGDTTLIPYGIGSMGSRSGPIGGSAVYLATKEIKGKMIAVAAALLGCRVEEISLSQGKFVGPKGPDGGSKSLSFNEVAAAAYDQRKETQSLSKGLSAEVYFEPQALTFSFGAVAVVVEIDKESGRVNLSSITALDDSGHVIDRDIVEGQVIGGIVHGIGNAYLEEIPYSKDGQPLAVNFLDYLIPTSLDVPPIELIEMETPSTLNPLGVKGAGEGGVIGALPALVNAVSDALGESVTKVPVDPEEVRQILMKKKATGRMPMR